MYLCGEKPEGDDIKMQAGSRRVRKFDRKLSAKREKKKCEKKFSARR